MFPVLPFYLSPNNLYHETFVAKYELRCSSQNHSGDVISI